MKMGTGQRRSIEFRFPRSFVIFWYAHLPLASVARLLAAHRTEPGDNENLRADEATWTAMQSSTSAVTLLCVLCHCLSTLVPIKVRWRYTYGESGVD